MDNQQVIDEIAAVTNLDPKDVRIAVESAAADVGQEEVDQALAELARPVPTGEGLTRRQAQKLLVEEMNAVAQLVNRSRLNKYNERSNKYWEKVDKIRRVQRQTAENNELKKKGKKAKWVVEELTEDDQKIGKEPQPPILLAPLRGGRRMLDEAVHRARAKGTHSELLEAAGFRPTRRR